MGLHVDVAFSCEFTLGKKKTSSPFTFPASQLATGLRCFKSSRAQKKRQQRRWSLGTVASFVVMDKWLVKKPGLPNNKDQKQPEGEERRNVFRFNDILYNSHLTGHQRQSTGGSGSVTTWVHMREEKIKTQLPEKSSDIFKGVNIYINGTFI